MPKDVHIIPHVGIGPFEFGMLKADIEDVMAKSRSLKFSVNAKRMIHLGPVQLEFGKASGRLSFIGLNHNSTFRCLFDGQDVFDLPGPELFALVASKDRRGPHVYDPREYLFPDLICTLWDADEQYDAKGNYARPVYAQIGLGNEEYLAELNA